MTSFDEDVVALRADMETVFEKISLCREMLIAGLSAQVRMSVWVCERK